MLVWNDPINLMSYVPWVFRKLFGYSKEKADQLMLDVHRKGRAVVSNGTREKAELDVFRLHEHGLWATMQHDGSIGLTLMLRRRRIKRAGDRPVPPQPAARGARPAAPICSPSCASLLGERPRSRTERIRRLFPTAYPDDPERDAEYQRFMREELVASHLGAIDRVERTLESEELTEAELLGWMQSSTPFGSCSARCSTSARTGPSESTRRSRRLTALYGYLSGLLDEAGQAPSS